MGYLTVEIPPERRDEMKEIERSDVHIYHVYRVVSGGDDSRIRNSFSNAILATTIDYDRVFVHSVCLSSIHAKQIHLRDACLEWAKI